LFHYYYSPEPLLKISEESSLPQICAS